MLLTYMASPYSHEDKAVREDRYVNACKAAAFLMRYTGDAVFCPIAHSHPIAEYGKLDCMDHDFWLKQDFGILRHSNEFCAVLLDGWENSRGMYMELLEWQKIGNAECRVIFANGNMTFMDTKDLIKTMEERSDNKDIRKRGKAGRAKRVVSPDTSDSRKKVGLNVKRGGRKVRST